MRTNFGNYTSNIKKLNKNVSQWRKFHYTPISNYILIFAIYLSISTCSTLVRNSVCAYFSYIFGFRPIWPLWLFEVAILTILYLIFRHGSFISPFIYAFWGIISHRRQRSVVRCMSYYVPLCKLGRNESVIRQSKNDLPLDSFQIR